MRYTTREGYHVRDGWLAIPAASNNAGSLISTPLNCVSDDGRCCATCKQWQGDVTRQRLAPCSLAPVRYVERPDGSCETVWHKRLAGHLCPRFAAAGIAQ